MADKINLNTASREELDSIPNIGDECVDKIVQARKDRGEFKSLDDLDEIGGFGDDAIQNLRQHATV